MHRKLWILALLVTGCSSPPPAAPVTPRPTPTPKIVIETTASPAIQPGLSALPGFEQSMTKSNPRPGDGDSIARGYQLYKANCIFCHGQELRGAGRMPSRNLADGNAYKYGASDQAVYRTILHGIPRGPMGSYVGILTEDQVWDLVNFLKSKRRSG